MHGSQKFRRSSSVLNTLIKNKSRFSYEPKMCPSELSYQEVKRGSKQFVFCMKDGDDKE